MSYQTGTATSMTNFKTIIETFCLANGYTISSDILNQGDMYMQLEVPSGAGYANSYHLRFRTNFSTDSTTVMETTGYHIFVPTDNWPFTYHLFAYTNPHTICGVALWASGRVMWFMFGLLDKIDASAYSRGEFIAASAPENCTESVGITTTMSRTSTGAIFSLPFVDYTVGLGSTGNNNSRIRASIDSHTAIQNYATLSTTYNVGWFGPYSSLIARIPNTWNSHTVLLPCTLYYKDSAISTKRMDLGQINNIRMTRIDNYNNGDIITIGANQWMVFSGSAKNTSDRDGASSSGTYGMAFKYDGP